MWTLSPRGPDWMPITPKTGSLFHAETQRATATASAEVGAGQAGQRCVSGNGWPPGPRAKSAVYISRSRARMTVLADHGAPLGVSTWRAFNSASQRHGPTSCQFRENRRNGPCSL